MQRDTLRPDAARRVSSHRVSRRRVGLRRSEQHARPDDGHVRRRLGGALQRRDRDQLARPPADDHGAPAGGRVRSPDHPDPRGRPLPRPGARDQQSGRDVRVLFAELEGADAGRRRRSLLRVSPGGGRTGAALVSAGLAGIGRMARRLGATLLVLLRARRARRTRQASRAAPQRAASFETDVPARLDRLPWSRWHARAVLALGITWILDGLEVTLVGSVAGVLREPQTLHLTDTDRGSGERLPRGGDRGRARLRAPDRHARPAAPLLRDALDLPRRHADDGALLRLRELRVLARRHGRRDRRRVRRRQLGHRRADARVRPRSRRSRDQQHLLDRDRARRGLHDRPARSPLGSRVSRLASGVRARRRPGRLRPRRASPLAREPSLALASRAHRRSGAHRRRHRGRRRAREGPAAAVGPPTRMQARGAIGFGDIARVLSSATGGGPSSGSRSWRRRRLRTTRSSSRTRSSSAGSTRWPPTTSGSTSCRSPSAICSGPIVLSRLFDTVGRRPMIALSYASAGILLGDHRRSLRGRIAHGLHADRPVVRGLLRRVGRGQLGVPDGERALSRSSSAGWRSPSSMPWARPSAASAHRPCWGLSSRAAAGPGSPPRTCSAAPSFLPAPPRPPPFGIAAERKSLEEIAAM